MAPLTCTDTHNMVAFLSKSDASDDFDQIVDFLNAHTIKYALMVNPTIYVSCIKQFWATATVEKVNGDVQLQALIDDKKVVVTEAIIRRDLHLDDANGVECLPNAETFKELVRMGYEKPPPKLTFYKAFFSTQWKFLIHTIVQCISAKRTAWNEFSTSMASTVICLATGRKFNFSKYIFDSMVRNVDSLSKFLMYPCFIQVLLDHQVDDMTTHNTKYKSPALTQKVFVNMRRVKKGFPGVETPLFNFMLVQSQQQAEASIEVLRRMPPNRGKIEAIDADEGTTLVDAETNEEEVALDAESQGRTNLKTKVHLVKENVNAASKGVSAIIAPELVSTAEPTVFDDEDVTMIMAQTLIKLQLDEREDDIDWSAVAEQVKERQSDSIKRYQDLKKKPVSVAQARKNMMVYLKNMAYYKMELFKGMTYDEIRPIFEREVANETLLQKGFKKLKAAKVSGSESTQEIPTDDPKEITEKDVQYMLEIVPVLEFRVEALQGHDIYMLIEKDYPLSNAVMILMLSEKLKFEEDNEMARDLVMKIFMEANRSGNISV
nr:hypothetical protein [Tanacetum cinerariifolium]